MMPLILAAVGEERIIQKIDGSSAVRAYLCDLEFVPGGTVIVVLALGGDLIVLVKRVHAAVDRKRAVYIPV